MVHCFVICQCSRLDMAEWDEGSSMTSGKLASCGALLSSSVSAPLDMAEWDEGSSMTSGKMVGCDAVVCCLSVLQEQACCNTSHHLFCVEPVISVAGPAAMLDAEPSLTGCQALLSLDGSAICARRDFQAVHIETFGRSQPI